MPILADKSIVPVLMFHSVGLRDQAWVWRHLSEPLEAFAKFLEALKRASFTTIGLDALQAHMRGDERAPANAIVLTFDDGYLDNWVYAMPLLRKHGFQATVFVSTDFVDPGNGLRSTLDDVWAGRVGAGDLRPAGFMNRDELRAAEGDGTLDIQSHARTHSWYFTSPDIVGWHRTGRLSPWPWMAWNARPDRKPFYLTEDQTGFVTPGTPVLAHDCALTARRFFPEAAAVEALRSGAAAALAKQGTEADLAHLAREAEGLTGRYESDEEREARVRGEIEGSRVLIGEWLDKAVDYICWPAGGSDDFCERVASGAGYRGWMLRSNQNRDKRNRPGSDPAGIKRMSGQRAVHLRGRAVGEGGVLYQKLQIDAHRGGLAAKGLLRAYKLGHWATMRTRARHP